MTLQKEFKNIFDFEEKENKFISAICKLKKNQQVCGLNIKADSSGKIKKFNLWRHVRRQHIEDYEYIQAKKEEEGAEAPCKKSKLVQETLDSYFQSSKITITMDAKTFREGLVEMICLSSAPLTMFNVPGRGFNKINGDLAKQLGISLGYDDVRDLVISSAHIARDELKVTLKSNLIYLKIDTATRKNRNFLAVNAQFYCDAKKQILHKLLDIVDTENQPSLEYIKKQIEIILQKFEIKASQILSICVDNAANISTPNDEENHKTLQWTLKPGLILPDYLIHAKVPVQFMHCGIHNLQLAIWAELHTDQANQTLLKSIRQAVKKLCTPSVSNILMERYGMTQSQETVTRWDSTFLMLDNFIKFKDFCKEAAANGTTELYFKESEWRNIEAIRNLLKQPYLTTLKLQSENLTPGEMFKEWYCLKKFLLEQEGEIAAGILSAMAIKENLIFCNTHFLAGVYCDARYRDLLTMEQKCLAKEGLVDINIRLEKRKIVENLPTDTASLDSSSADDDYERVLKAEFLKSCEIIEKLCRFKVNNVFEAISKYPENLQLPYQIASSILTPHRRVESLFSSLMLQQSLNDDLTSAILFYKFNYSE